MRNSPLLTKLLKTSLIVLLISSCATTPDKLLRHPTLKQILRFRTGLKNPSNRSCVDYDDKNKCLREENFEYDLRILDTRKMLNDLGFICKVAEQRYKIDPETPRLRRDNYYKCGFLKLKRCVDRSYIDVENVDFLRQANTKCFSSRVYRFDQIK